MAKFCGCLSQIRGALKIGRVGVKETGGITLIGFLLSTGLAVVVSGLVGQPPFVPVAIASVLVPIMNFIILRKFVFVGAAR